MKNIRNILYIAICFALIGAKQVLGATVEWPSAQTSDLKYFEYRVPGVIYLVAGSAPSEWGTYNNSLIVTAAGQAPRDALYWKFIPPGRLVISADGIFKATFQRTP